MRGWEGRTRTGGEGLRGMDFQASSSSQDWRHGRFFVLQHACNYQILNLWYSILKVVRPMPVAMLRTSSHRPVFQCFTGLGSSGSLYPSPERRARRTSYSEHVMKLPSWHQQPQHHNTSVTNTTKCSHKSDNPHHQHNLQQQEQQEPQQ